MMLVLNILHLERNNKIYIYKEINAYTYFESIINFYNIVKNNFQEFYSGIKALTSLYNGMTTIGRKMIHHDIITEIDTYDIFRACYLYFLNKLSFHGLDYNIKIQPPNYYKCKYISDLLKRVNFIYCCDTKEALVRVCKNDLVCIRVFNT